MRFSFPQLNISKTIKQLLGQKSTWLAILSVVILALAGSFFFFRKDSFQAEASWWDEDWHYRMKVTIDATKIDADLTNYPVAVVLTTSNFTYANAQSAGQDIRFTDANGNTLYHEIEKWNSGATSTIWVKIPQVADTVNTIFYMYYGNGLVADGQNKTAVWDDDFVGVWHMNNTATGTDSFVDASKYNNHGTGYDEGGSLQATSTGTIDGAFNFDGSDDHIRVPDASSLSGMNQLSMSAWVYFDQLPTTVAHDVEIMVKRHSTDPWNSYYFDIVGTACTNDNVMYVSLKNQAEAAEYRCASSSLTASQWYYVAATWDGSDLHFYLNGINDDEGATNFAGDSIFSSDGTLYINGDDSGPGRMDGKIDDVRISKIARSAAWLRADYYNGINNLLILNAEEKGPGPVAYWSFDEGHGQIAYDKSANDNNLLLGGNTDTISRDPAWITSGRFGNALRFDDTDPEDWAAASSSASVAITDSITLEAWVQLRNYDGYYMDIVSKDSTANFSYWLGIDDVSGRPMMILTNNGSSQTQAYAPDGLQENTWYHIAGVYDGATMRVYVNGILASNGTNNPRSYSSGIYENSNSDVNVGSSQYWPNNGWNGDIDEVKIYNYARTAEQIKADYNKSFNVMLGNNEYTSLSNGLLMQWQMDEVSWNGTAGEVKDSSGNNNHGTASNALTTSTAKFNRAANIDGDSDQVYINPAGTNLAGLTTSSLTMSVWLKTNTVSKSFADITGADGSTYFVHLVNSGSIVRAYFYVNGTEQKVLESDSGSISIGQWYHMAVTRDYETGDTILYLDGVEVDRLQAIGTTGYTPTVISVGTGGEYCFDGQLDDFRIYNRALSPDEVRRLYEWAPGPVSHWKFDENTGTTANDTAVSSTYSGSNHGTLGGGEGAARVPIWQAGSCKFGSCLKFDGDDDFVRLARDFANDNLTITMWFNGDDTTGRQLAGHRSIAYSSLKRANATSISLRTSENVIRTFTVPTMSPGIWYHLAVVRGSGVFRIYLNGIESTTGAIADSGDFEIDSIGLYQGGQEFKGYIDDVRFYNYARNQRQILEDMHAGKKNNPIGYWSFDEGQGGTAYDRGYLATLGSGNNGTLINMTTSGPSSVWSPSGKAGKALQFDGSNDYVSVINSNITNYNQSRSVSLWFKTNTLGSQKGIIGTGVTVLEDSPFWLLTQSDENKISLYHSGYYDGSTTLERNKWYHLVYTYDRPSNYLVLYLDGKVEYAGIINDVDNDKANIYIGGGWGGYFKGQIDEVKIYNYALTVDEIRQNYNTGQQIVLSRSANDNLTDGLLAYWPMDGNLDDASGNGNTGSATGATATSSAKFGKAYAIGGGSNYISVDTSASLDSYTNKLTVSGWYYFNNLDAVQQWLFDKGSNYYLRVTSTGGFTNYLFGINNEDYWTTQAGLVTAGHWYYIVFTYDGQERKIYVDGELKESRKDSGNIDNGGNITIGNRSSHIEPMDGQVDDIKIYNRTLSADEIAQNYTDGLPPVAYWKFDEGSNLTAYDSIGGNHLTLGYDSYDEPSWEPIGKIGSSINLHGNNEAAGIEYTNLSNDFPGKYDTGINYGMSAMAWVKLRDNTRQDILCMGSGSWCFWVDDDSHLTEYATQIFGDTAVPINEWFHMAFTYDGQTAKLYLNGVLDKTKADNEGIPAEGYHFLIGSLGSDYPDGLVDEAKVYNYARTQRQILEDMNAGKKNNPAGYWKFDEGQGNTAYDYSGQGNNGTLSIGTGGTQSATSSAWTNGASGKINGSLNFDGTDDEVIMPGPELSTDGTIAGWFYWVGGDTSLVRDHTSSNGWILGYGSSGILRYRVGGTEFITNVNIGSLQNKWTHYAVTKNGANSSYYIDGSLVYSGSNAGNTTSTMPWHLMKNGSTSGYISGQADEVKIWNYPLTPSEVKNEYNGGFSSFFR